MRILIAEDSRTQAAHLRRILEEAGFTVTTAFDGQAALEAAKAGGVDLVLSDVVMPKLSGYELTRALRQDAATRGLPVVLMTSLNQPEDVVRALAAGADNFVNKPYAPAELVARLRRTMASRTFGLGKLDVTVQGETYKLDQPPATILAVLMSALEDSAKRERDLEASRKKLAEATIERERFLSVVAHELRTPLNVLAMRASLDARARHRDAHRPPTGEPLPEVVTRQVGKMVALLDDLLDTARIDQGDLRIETRPSDLVALAKEAVSAARLSNSHDIRLEAPASLLVVLDPARIGQVLNNFLTNALKYAPAGTVVDMELLADERSAKVHVKDQGIGIGEEDVVHVFDRYFRSEAGRKASKGLGLGLAICRQIVELHGGTIGVESRENEGSDFWFEIPGVVPHAEASGTVLT